MEKQKIFTQNLFEICFYIFYCMSILYFINSIYFNSLNLTEVINFPSFIIFLLMIEAKIFSKKELILQKHYKNILLVNLIVITLSFIIDLKIL